jgi:hypothetical protein
MAARLEAASKQFNVQILVSGFLVKILSHKMQGQLRHIDTVTVKGSNVPVGNYSFVLVSFFIILLNFGLYFSFFFF